MTEFFLPVDVTFDPDPTLDCGQAFRWHLGEDNIWRGVLKFGYIEIEKLDSGLLVRYISPRGWDKSAVEEYLNNYLNLSFDQKKFRDHVLDAAGEERGFFQKILDYSPGLRILNQEPFEMAISYILSIQSSIKLIGQRIENISAMFPENEIKGVGRHLFPTLNQLKAEKGRLSTLNLGFRLKYIESFVENLKSENELEEIRDLPYEKQFEYLTSHYGIGPKVAHCILLFSFQEEHVVPVDVWIKRFYDKYCVDGGESFYEKFYPYGGVLQEYIFRWMRSGA